MRGDDFHELLEGWYPHFLGWLWILIPLLFWVTLLVLMAWGVSRMLSIQRGRKQEHPDRQWSQGEEILRERYARGEIDTEEYVERSRILGDEHHNYGAPPP
jgi:putative membrane protein